MRSPTLAAAIVFSALPEQAAGFAPIIHNGQQLFSPPLLTSSTTTTSFRKHNIELHESKVSVLDRILPKYKLPITSQSTPTDQALSTALSDQKLKSSSSWSYGEFAKQYPNVNNIGIATIKTASADLLAQVVIAQTPVTEIDWQRAFLFCAFGATYLGAFQYWYQVNIFKKLFDVDKFTSQPWSEKAKDAEGLKSLAAQTAVDLTVLSLIYLPTFYIFKASVFSGSADPSVWVSQGVDNYTNNFSKDEVDLVRVWLPADLVCFSVPLYLRLPVRHIVSFVWTAYLSFARGGH